MYSTADRSTSRGAAWAPFQWRVNPSIPHIERPGQLCRLTSSTVDAVGQFWFYVEFSDGHRSAYLPGDLLAEPAVQS